MRDIGEYQLTLIRRILLLCPPCQVDSGSKVVHPKRDAPVGHVPVPFQRAAFADGIDALRVVDDAALSSSAVVTIDNGVSLTDVAMSVVEHVGDRLPSSQVAFVAL